MKRIVILSFAILFCVFQANAQTEPNERKNLSANDSTTINPANIASPSFNTENLKLDLQESNKEFDLMKDVHLISHLILTRTSTHLSAYGKVVISFSTAGQAICLG